MSGPPFSEVTWGRWGISILNSFKSMRVSYTKGYLKFFVLSTRNETLRLERQNCLFLRGTVECPRKGQDPNTLQMCLYVTTHVTRPSVKMDVRITR